MVALADLNGDELSFSFDTQSMEHGMNLTMNGSQPAPGLRTQQQRANEGSYNGTTTDDLLGQVGVGVASISASSLHSLYQNHVANSRSQSTSSSGSGGRVSPSSLLAQNNNLVAGAAGLLPPVQPPNSSQSCLQNYGSLVSAAIGSLGRSPPPPICVNANLRRYSCKLCPSMFDSKAELQIHTQVHMREAKPYKCTHCPKSFANSSYLSQHMRIHLGIKPFGPCQYCGRKFTQLSHLQQHLRTHTGEKPYKCRYPGCEKAFSQLSNLQSHSRCHQTDKPYKCNSCYKCFTDEQALLDHIPKHKESKHLKVHICPYCGKSYTQATYLAKHMTKHADKRDRDSARIRVPSDDNMWSPRDNPVCAIHGVADSCSEISPSALPFNSFPAHNHHSGVMPPQNSAYCASTMAGMAGTESAFTRLGLGALGARMTANSRNPYHFSYDSFKPTAHAAGLSHHGAPAFHNQLIRLDDIRNYSANMPSVSNFEMLMGKREPRETAY